MTDTSGGPPVRRVRAGVVVGGIALGVVLSWLCFVLLLAVPVPGDSPARVVLPLALPAVVGIGLFAHPRTRQAGTGFLMGLAIGMITGAGVCSLTLTVLS